MGRGIGDQNLLGRMLAYGKYIAIGIFEPGYLAAVGGGPNTEILVLGEGIFFGGNAVVPEPGGDRLDVFDLPAKDGTLQGSEIRDLGDPHHVAADVHDQSKLIKTYELKSKLAFIKGSRSLVVLCGDEADHL